MKSLCLITPVLPPAMDGLGDFSWRLWEHWPDSPEPLTWKFLVAGGASESRSRFPFEIRQFEKNRESLVAALDEFSGQKVMLQYVGYAFAPDGAPLWLPAAFKQWKGKGSGRQVFVNFHETWASGKPWQKAFWTQPKQKRCAADLMAVADGSATTNPATLRDLDSLQTGRSVVLIPIGANLLVKNPPEKNWRQMVIFGKEASRLRALNLHANLLKSLTEGQAIDRIVLAGESPSPESDPSASLLRSWNLPVGLETSFNFSGSALPEVVQASGLSLMHTSTTCLLKSGCFQLAAHLGQVAITVQEEDPGAPVTPGRHCLTYEVNDPAAIGRVLSQPSTLHQISEAAAELGATSLSWTVIARSWADFIER